MRHIAGMGMAVVGVAMLTGCAVETVGRGPDAHVRYRDSSTVIVVDHPGYRVVHEPPPRHEQYRDERRERHEDRREIRRDERRRDEGRPSFRRNDDRDSGREIRVIQRPGHSVSQNGNNGNRGNNGNNGNNGKRPSKLDRRQHGNQDNADQ